MKPSLDSTIQFLVVSLPHRRKEKNRTDGNIAILRQMPGRTSLPCRLYRTALGPTGHRHCLVESPMRSEPAPKKALSLVEDISWAGDHQ